MADHDQALSTEAGELLASRLAEKRQDIEAQMHALEQSVRAGSGDISLVRNMREGTHLSPSHLLDIAEHDRLLTELRTVRRAEAKVADGTHGQCDVCGTDISQARLEVHFWIVTCINCDAALPR